MIPPVDKDREEETLLVLAYRHLGTYIAIDLHSMLAGTVVEVASFSLGISDEETVAEILEVFRRSIVRKMRDVGSVDADRNVMTMNPKSKGISN